MPFFHDQGREALRQSYLDAWRKHRESLPMEPLEHQLATVVEQHPEYHAFIEGDPDAINRDFTPEGGQSNPFLHMGLHLAIREQVATNRPVGVALVYADLCRRIGDVHEAEHRMIEVLAETLWEAQRAGSAPDEQGYLERLRRL
jgi:Domain of unknown function (DUF1841)